MSQNSDRDWTVVLSHGWAMQDVFWEPLRKALGNREYFCISRPYFGEPVAEFRAPETPWIGIGHSQGFQRLLKLDLDHCQALISLSGFWSFCGRGGTSRRIVQRMVRAFAQDPTEVLRSFYRNCGVDFEPPEQLNYSALQQDLELLLDSTLSESGKKTECHGVPVFAITGAQDKIVPCELAQNEFGNLTIHPDAGHSLGYDEAGWCALQIEHILHSI